MYNVLEKNRGQAEIIGYILLFSLILITSGIVFVQGTASLDSAREVEQTRNAQRAFDILSNNIQDLTRDASPERQTEIQLGGGRVSFEDSISYNITVVNSTGVEFKYPTRTRPLTYESNADAQGEVTYTNGMIIRTENGNNNIIKKPSMRLSGDRIFLTQYRIRPPSDGRNAIAGDRNAVIRTVGANAEVIFFNNVQEVRVEIGPTPRVSAWEFLHETNGFTCTSTGTNKIECTKSSVKSVHIQEWLILTELL